MTLSHTSSRVANVIEPRLRDAERQKSNLNSWRFCYEAFGDPSSTPESLALNLGFFLASWGMMRGSSFLRQYDFTVHLPIVDIVRTSEARRLRHSNADGPSDIKEVFRVRDAIADNYRSLPQRGRLINVTDTLSSKIMLATLGCVPAYDRYFVAGARAEKIPTRFNEKSIISLQQHIAGRADEYEEARRITEQRLGAPIPLMRVVDMYFFTVGKQD
ncbi:hypothetical protein ASF69_09025 [Rhizobium sp. Leaf311]|uniref:hypothetical protein n=1 Tax=Rhizobium sp. Leaf311 TaxID=1736332 RepID=UPI0007158A65|nr:hypothetical protein [Rhizobium sp. Leaf311]KQQ44735.1 hypothetical protein ASF69_09025 [Rhizobium sp. Leaf311]